MSVESHAKVLVSFCRTEGFRELEICGEDTSTERLSWLVWLVCSRESKVKGMVLHVYQLYVDEI